VKGMLEGEDSRTLDHMRRDGGISMPPLKTFKGTSNTGNLQKALDLAIQAAQKAAPGADQVTTWTLDTVTGRQGGLLGLKEVTVAIKARAS